MPFYFRIPLPGPFGYSTRIGGRKRRGPTAAHNSVAQQLGDAMRLALSEREHNKPENVAAREAALLDFQSRIRRGKITACAIDPLKGGTFTLTDADDNHVKIEVEAGSAQDFLSLRKGDIAEIVIGKDGSGMEYFDHICCANGAVPRVRACEWIGL